MYYLCLFLLFTQQLWAQKKVDTLAMVKHTPIRDQQMSGTCWSFATTSFLESEILRINPQIKNIDLSEMFFVYHNYTNKLQRFYLKHGYMFWTMGGQPHDVLKIVFEKGFVPEYAYHGYTTSDKGHHHARLDTALKNIALKIDYTIPMSVYMKKFADTLNCFLGKVPEKFIYEKRQITPKEYSALLGIDAQKYVNLTSYLHHPYYEWFVLESRFNWADVLFFNIPWNQFESICDSALIKGYSFVWNGDVSEQTFDYMSGFAVWNDKILNIDTERLDHFFIHKTQVEHVMHVIGLLKIDGKKYYLVKNSWGKIGNFKGYILMSEDYFRLKTVSITVSSDILPEDFVRKMIKKQFFPFAY
ncbi:MAG: C1 family peptidase [Bacteroidales bacterium]|nr:C1 family peptidase [Bacteroidales bacterium]